MISSQCCCLVSLAGLMHQARVCWAICCRQCPVGPPPKSISLSLTWRLSYLHWTKDGFMVNENQPSLCWALLCLCHLSRVFLSPLPCCLSPVMTQVMKLGICWLCHCS